MILVGCPLRVRLGLSRRVRSRDSTDANSPAVRDFRHRQARAELLAIAVLESSAVREERQAEVRPVRRRPSQHHAVLGDDEIALAGLQHGGGFALGDLDPDLGREDLPQPRLPDPGVRLDLALELPDVERQEVAEFRRVGQGPDIAGHEFPFRLDPRGLDVELGGRDQQEISLGETEEDGRDQQEEQGDVAGPDDERPLDFLTGAFSSPRWKRAGSPEAAGGRKRKGGLR